MKYKVRLLFIIATLFLTACAGPPAHYRVNMTDFEAQKENGIVFGRMTQQRFFGLFMGNLDDSGTGMGFKNVKTGERFGYNWATYFEMMLPPGTYELVDIGSPSGALYPKTVPFVFTVDQGDIKYIGSIVGDRDLHRLLTKKNIPEEKAFLEIKSHKQYGPIDYFIVDEDRMVIDEFLKKHPEINPSQIRKDFME
jgi:hypothetical protein